MRTSKPLILYSLAAVGLLFYVERVLAPGYGIKSILKLLAFLAGSAWVQRRWGAGSAGVHAKGSGQGGPSWKRLFLLGMGAFCAVLGAYFLLRGQIDLKAIQGQLEETLDIDAGNFIWVGLYIIAVNSAAEEFFFRGFLFLNLRRNPSVSRTAAHGISAGLFSVYHIAIFKSWFELKVMLLALAGLFATGVFFNWLDERRESILSSWIVHACGDAAIIAIGLHMFGLLGG